MGAGRTRRGRPRDLVELALRFGDPGLILFLGDRAHLDRHVGVLDPAQLRTLAVIDARALDVEPALVGPTAGASVPAIVS